MYVNRVEVINARLSNLRFADNIVPLADKFKKCEALLFALNYAAKITVCVVQVIDKYIYLGQKHLSRT